MSSAENASGLLMEPQDQSRFLAPERFRQLTDTDFGTFEVTGMELTYHNWYDSKKECLAAFSFPPNKT